MKPFGSSRSGQVASPQLVAVVSQNTDGFGIRSACRTLRNPHKVIAAGLLFSSRRSIKPSGYLTFRGLINGGEKQ